MREGLRNLVAVTIEIVCGRWQWSRKLAGGHWELWHIADPVNARLWIRGECYKTAGRPGLGRGIPVCEDY